MSKNGKSNGEKKARAIREAVTVSDKFYPELKGRFLCPVCLSYTAPDRHGDITYGHIIPSAAGGTKTVLLCRKCNSSFGHAQDVAFGDYLHILKSGKRDLFQLKQIPRHFAVNGIKVSGEIVSDDNGIGLYIWQNRSDPKNVQAVLNVFANSQLARKEDDFSDTSISVDTKAPLLGQSDQVDRGFLTAAYLFWVYELGYSFALQAHLDPIRDAILGRVALARQSVKRLTSRVFKAPWIGSGELQGEAVLLCGIADRIIVLPLPTNVEGYERLGRNTEAKWSLKEGTYTPLTFRGSPPARSPLAVLFGQKMLVMPDAVARLQQGAVCFYVPADGAPPVVLSAISESDAQILKDRGVEALRPDGIIPVPDSETGRPKE